MSQSPSLPIKLPLKELPFVIVALIVIFIWSVFMVVGFISIDDIGFRFIIIFTIVCGPLLYFLTKYHKREKTEDELYLFLNEDAIVYKGQRILTMKLNPSTIFSVVQVTIKIESILIISKLRDTMTASLYPSANWKWNTGAN